MGGFGNGGKGANSGVLHVLHANAAVGPSLSQVFAAKPNPFFELSFFILTLSVENEARFFFDTLPPFFLVSK